MESLGSQSARNPPCEEDAALTLQLATFGLVYPTALHRGGSENTC